MDQLIAKYKYRTSISVPYGILPMFEDGFIKHKENNNTIEYNVEYIDERCIYSKEIPKYINFNYRHNLIEIEYLNTENIETMKEMFQGCTSLIKLNLNNCKTYNVIDMQRLFCGCYNLKSLDLSSFNTSNVTNMSYMFDSCHLLDNLNIENFNTTNVIDMKCMFYNCNSFTLLNLSHFDTKNVTDVSGMFYNCNKLKELNLSSWNLDNAIEHGSFSSMFYNCNSLQVLRLDNCSHNTIKNIISSSSFPKNKIEGITKKIYCKKDNAWGLEVPENWRFEYIEDIKENLS